MIIKETWTREEHRQAWFSEDERYRYLLDIIWDASLERIAVIGLNPSTADHLQDDNTMARIKGFARSWGYGGFRMLNAFAYRSTDPGELFKVADPIGPENTIEFLRAAAFPTTLAAWGTTIQQKRWVYWYRGHDLSEALTLRCFRRTRAGHPEHPLYLPSDIVHQPFSYTEDA